MSDCRDCQRFVWTPADMERYFPGLAILSSAYGSVASGTGYCEAHDRLQRAIPACEDFDSVRKEHPSTAPLEAP